MQALIYRKPIFNLPVYYQLPQSVFSSRNIRNENFLRIRPENCPSTSQTPLLCSVTPPQSLSYGGWDELQLKGDSVHSSDSNKLNNFLNYLGIGDRKYFFVYLFGFVCALAISRVKVSSIVVVPACAIVFALGFSIGLIKKSNGKELRVNGNKQKLPDENFGALVESLTNLKDGLNGYNVKILSLKNGIRRSIEGNQVTVDDLEGYIDVLESNDVAFRSTLDVVESCIYYIRHGNQEKEGDFDDDTLGKRKKLIDNGFKLSRLFGGLFGKKIAHATPGIVKDSGKKELKHAKINNQKGTNMLADSVEDKNLDFVLNENLENARSKRRAENQVNGTGAKNNFFSKKDLVDKNGSAESVSERSVYGNQSDKSRPDINQLYYFKDYSDEIETMASHNGSFDSVDFSFCVKHAKSTSSFGQRKIREAPSRNYWHSESTEDDHRHYQKYSAKQNTFDLEHPTSFANQEPSHSNIFHPPSSMLDIDLEFNRYLMEANNLLKEAHRYLRHQNGDCFSETALYESAVLLSEAIKMRPMSLLAVGQLGNTYLLHGELKLKMSRELRSLLGSTNPFSVEVSGVIGRFGDQLADKEKIRLVLTDVCEECEELLVRAGRRYRAALSIDGNDMRALYNWGLALSFRAQLIADVGPSAARDADKIFMAAVDKFDAIMSKGNDYAPDALFEWGTVLQRRSQLRPRTSREKVKLLQQARRLYEDALHLDSGNPQLQEALSTCVSELDYWYG